MNNLDKISDLENVGYIEDLAYELRPLLPWVYRNYSINTIIEELLCVLEDFDDEIVTKGGILDILIARLNERAERNRFGSDFSFADTVRVVRRKLGIGRG